MLRAEQRRLQSALDQLAMRIDTFERSGSPEPEAAPPEPPPLPKPTFDAPVPEEAPALPLAPPRILEEHAAEPRPAADSFELRLGRVWLARIGIVILLTGLVFLGNYAYHAFIGRLGPAGKLLLIYLAGGGLCGLGSWIGRRRESLETYGRVLLAGGCATIYYATYAAHFVATLRVVESPILAGALLLLLGGGFVCLADRLRSQTLAAATVALSFYTAAINPAQTFSLFSNLVISAAAIALLARRRWVSVSFLSLAGSYGAFAFWRFRDGLAFPPPDAASQFWPAVLFPAAYWLVHTAAVMLRRVDAFDPTARPAFLTLNNIAFFSLAGPAVAGVHPQFFWLAACAYGAVLIMLAAVAGRRSPDEAFFDGAYLAQGLGLVVLGLFHKLSAMGWQQPISYALLSAALISLGRLRHGGVYRFFAGLTALAAALSAWEKLPSGGDHARLAAVATAVILAAAAWLLKKQSGLQPRADWRALGLALLAGGLAAPACIDSDLFASSLRLLGIALAAMLSLRALKLPELAYAAQPLALGGQALLVIHAAIHNAPAASLLVSAGAALAFIHLWQWRTAFPLAGRRIWQSLHAIVPEILVPWWSFAHLAANDRAPFLASVALALLVHGCLTRVRLLSLASAPLTAAAICLAGIALANQLPWPGAAITVALLVGQSFVLSRIAGQSALAQILRGAAIALATGMAFAYLPAGAWFLTLSFGALAFFLATCLRRSGEAMLYAAALAAAAACVWTIRLPLAPASWADFLPFVLAIAAQRLGRRRLADTGWFTPGIQSAFCAALVLGMWILLHRLVAVMAGGFLLTVSWSLLALVVLGAGFALRERIYRWLGLLILAAAVGRVFCIDVWQLETIYRILSFLVLGAVLLALGFLYNRFADALRRWL